MSRPLRIEFPGAVYHVTSRGNRREPIYRDGVDRLAQLDVLAQAMDRFDAQVGQSVTPPWLDSTGLHGYLLGRSVVTAADTRRACRRYAELVSQAQAQDATFWRDALQSQVYLGDENFVQRMQAQMQPHQQQDMQIPKVQRLQTQSWSAWLTQCQGDRNQALYQAYQQGGMTMTQLSRASGLSMSHVSRLIAKGEKERSETLRPLR